MRLRVLLGALLVLGLLAGTAQATETETYSVTASNAKPYVLFFSTSRVGDVTARLQWSGKPSGVWFWITTVQNFDTPMGCDRYTGESDTPAPGDWTCTLYGAPIGQYRIYIDTFSGGKLTGGTLSVTAETDP